MTTSKELVFRQDDLDRLTWFLRGDDGREHGALLLFGKATVARDPWTTQQREKYLCREIIELAERDLIESSGDRLTFSNNAFVALLKRARAGRLVAGVAHNHGRGFGRFSAVDDEGEKGLLQLARNRNGPESEIVSALICEARLATARIWSQESSVQDVACVSQVGRRFVVGRAPSVHPHNEALARQALAFGKSLNDTLGEIRIGIVGCGATGSAVAMLLARLGVGRLCLIDHDRVDVSNLNRLHGATMEDAREGRLKVDVVARMVRSMGLGCEVVTHDALVVEPSVRDAMKACDIVFGCTDDHQGRALLNRFAYFYLTPVFDLGMAISVGRDNPPSIQALDGRLSVLIPGVTCLLCRSVIDVRRAATEAVRRADPARYRILKAEAYVEGEGDPNPAVVTFTTELAAVAVNEMLHRLTGYKGTEEQTPHRTRLFHRMHDLRPGDRPRKDCAICGTPETWGLGDVEPFLDIIS